ncbi:MAG TPA: TetR/AcrR family transcriptional regulator [Pseudonocardiaceae bacterium]|nr:TetR/AcrR family transcriptional regulator [Pseudonocardiaceae bacterium]
MRCSALVRKPAPARVRWLLWLGGAERVPGVPGSAADRGWELVDVSSTVRGAAERGADRGVESDAESSAESRLRSGDERAAAEPFDGLDAPAAADAPADGRAARSQRTRRAILDGMRALHAEGDLRPTAPRIAQRAGVSLRTVWQQFTDMETLLVEAIERDNEILRSLIEPVEPDQPLAVRIALFVGRRSSVLEQMTPTWRAARLHRSPSQPLRQNKIRTLTRARAELETTFALELGQLADNRRERLVDALHAITIWSFWESLRVDLGLGTTSAEELVSATFTALLAKAGFAA